MPMIVWQKVGLSVTTTSVFTMGVAWLSAHRLGLSGAELWISIAAIATGTLALSGLAVGLGSLYPNFQEDNPARIVSGLGGTLNFLLSVLYILLASAAQALVFHRTRLAPYLEGISEARILGTALGALILLSALTALLPLYLGIRNLRRAEIH
jgi:ABC-2 type transport system permease protein